jgi:hypothetical protein
MSFVVNDTAYVGFGSDQDIFNKDLWAYDEISNSWDQRADCDGVARGAGGTFALNGRGFICCGADGGFKEDLWEYDPINDQWKIRAYFPTDGRRYGISFALNGLGYFGCGKGSFGQKRSFYEYTPMTAFGWMMEELGVDELDISNVATYPNPVIDHATVTWNSIVQVDHGILYNQFGAVAGRFEADGNSIYLDRKNNAAGIYFLSLFDSQNTIVLTDKIMLK